MRRRRSCHGEISLRRFTARRHLQLDGITAPRQALRGFGSSLHPVPSERKQGERYVSPRKSTSGIRAVSRSRHQPGRLLDLTHAVGVDTIGIIELAEHLGMPFDRGEELIGQRRCRL